MRLYNTLTRKTEKFIPSDNNNVKMYTCGPTVYHYAHVGNLRTYIFEDILEKTLNYVGYKVNRVMNITDVGHLSSDSDSGQDKMLKGAKREKKSILEIAQFYTDEFFKDMDYLNIKKPNIISKATDNIDIYIDIISKLLKKDYAYEANGNIYFDITKLEDYYKLTNHNIDDMVVGARENVDEDLFKRNQSDFVLWFTKSKFDDQELKWNSPFGVGYPGWHIECSGISMKYFGETLDIHCGGVDNIFPHHTNEIAQSEAYLGHKWCNYWCHGEHLNDNTGKMSKSNGEFLTLNLLMKKGYNPLIYRFFCLNSHYRKQLVFSYETMDSTKNSYEKLKRKINQIKNLEMGTINNDDLTKYKILFKTYIENDLNIANGIMVLYDVLKDENLSNITKVELIKDFDTVLSLDLLKEEDIITDDNLVIYINEMIDKRTIAKNNKDYQLSDKIRNELLEKGIVLKDTREGTIYEIEKR